MTDEKRLIMLEELRKILPDRDIAIDEAMSRHTSFKIGGPATFLVNVGDSDDLIAVISLCKKENVNYYPVGNGSNLLVSDQGFDGVIIKFSGDLATISIVDEINEGTGLITAGAGAGFTVLSVYAARKGFTGLEFAYGIPGTVGGAVIMNAGAYGGEVKQVIVSAKVLTPDLKIKDVMLEDMDLSYRHSAFKEKGYIVLSASFRLKVYPKILIRAVMENYKKARHDKQPLEYPSAGSTFKRPEGYFAGKLIQDAGLKGYSVGDAAVSEKHSGFVINKGNASCDDVVKLINDVKAKVLENSGVELSPEVIFLGVEK